MMVSLLTVPLMANRAVASGRDHGFVSLTYDDGLPCHLDVAVPALDRRDLRATFYVTWENIAPRAAEWAGLVRCGHELADHTMHHPCDLGRLPAASFAGRELRPMERWLDQAAGRHRPRDYAYPCDVTNLGPGRANQQARRYHRLLRAIGIGSARTSEGPPNPPAWVKAHPYRLQALALGYDAPTLPDVLDYLRRAREQRRWAILVLHQIGNGMTGDGFVSVADHDRLLDALAASDMMVRTVGEVVRTLRAT